MDPFTIGMIIAAGASAVGGIVGGLIEQGKREEAAKILKKAYEQYGDIEPEHLDAVAAQILPDSQLAAVKVDPRYKESQLKALGGLEDVAAAGGETAMDRAVLDKQISAANRQAFGAQGALRENLARRGALNSGAGLILQQQGNQDAAERSRQTALDVSGRAQDRALKSMLQAGDMAGGLRQQEWGEQSSAAKAADEIARWNAESQDRAGRYANDVKQRNYDNAMKQAQARLQGQLAEADMIAGDGARAAQTATGVGEGVGNAATAIGQYNSPQNDPDYIAYLKSKGK